MLHRKAKLNELKDRRKSHILEFAFQTSLIPSELDNRNIVTRDRDQRLLKQSRAINPAYSRSLKHRIASAWNALHIDIRAIEEGPKFFLGLLIVLLTQNIKSSYMIFNSKIRRIEQQIAG